MSEPTLQPTDATESDSPIPTEPERLNPYGLSNYDLLNACVRFGMERYRAKQMRDWMFRHLVAEIGQYSNVSNRDRKVISASFELAPGEVVNQQVSEDGTFKLLVKWKRPEGFDNPTTETVMIPDEDRRTACVSSQIGCPVGCRFCASGVNGLKANLDAGEIVFQVVLLNRILLQQKEHLTNLVFMGMGEPLANFANVIKAIRVITDEHGIAMGARRITVSTVGVPSKIRELADIGISVNLALSLHAPNEPLRRQLIPWAEHFALPEILDACRYYFDQTGREITLEYILLHGVNDKPEHAKELAQVCRTIRSNVNLIRYNEVEGLPFERPKSDDVMAFQAILQDAGVNAHVRKSRGRDIAAACGQLRRQNMAGTPQPITLN
jgi:23S rRNA (adenine2503-C2)-methyltransferase